MLKLFFSYSHKDESIRNELEVHLAMLKHQGVIEPWHDRRIVGGDDFANVISEQLDQADIILFLVSPHFLASRYCYDIEVTRALERHDAKEARVIPIIVDPCEWKEAPFARLAALPIDGKPISKYPNQNDAFLEIVQAIRVAARSDNDSRINKSKSPDINRPRPTAELRSSNLRIRKEFTDQDRDTFRDESYDYIQKYFEGSLDELQLRNPEITGRFRRVSANHFTAEIYRNGKRVGACGIRLAKFFSHTQIVFSHDPNATNSMNEGIDVSDDGQTLFLKATGMAAMYGTRRNETDQLTQQGAAELLWGLLIEPLQR